MFARGVICLFVLLVGLATAHKSLPYLTRNDKTYLQSVFDSGYSTKSVSGDVQSVFLSVKGYHLLEKRFPREKEACGLFQNAYLHGESIDELFAASSGAVLLAGSDCRLDLSRDKKVVSEIDQVDSIEKLYKIVRILDNVKQKVDSESVKKSMERFLKKDSSARSQAWSYSIAALLWRENKDELGRYIAEIEDTVQQADEADNIHLYYEEGAQGTAEIVWAVAELCRVAGRPLPIARDKLAKFGAYLVARRHSRQLRVAVAVAEAVQALSRVSNAVVTAAMEKEGVSLTGTSGEPHALVTLASLWGEPVDGAVLQADTVKHARTGATVMARQALTQTPQLGAGMYRLDLSSARAQLEPGLYSLQLSGSTRAATGNGTTDKDKSGDATGTPVNTVLSLKVMASIVLEGVELSIRERDQIAGALAYKLTQGAAPLSDRLAISWLHRLELKFSVSDSTGAKSVLAPHQVFLRMTHAHTGQQITFVVEPEHSTNVYKFTLDLEKSNKDFDNVSGDYKMELLVGDAVLERPLYWLLAVIKLDMPGIPTGSSTGTETPDSSRRSVAGSKRASSASNPRVGTGPSVAKPQIFHQFRPAEKRGGHFISLVFTVLCTVPPAVIMLGLWYLVGLNVSNFQLSLSGLLFHGGICAIFALYYCYWSFLNMFSTLQMLAPLGALTAFFGNRVLRQIALKRKEAQTQ